jgi:hypothetical protein
MLIITIMDKMKHIKYFFFCFFLLSFISLMSDGSTQEVLDSPIVLNYAHNELPNWGVLKNIEGFVYIDLDDDYIHKLIAFIKDDGFEEPPYFGAGLVGAHITVIYPEEITKYGIEEIQECGEIIFFTLKDCKIVHPPKWQKIDEVYFIVIDAPQLDQIRQKYGLPTREYDFHITIGVKPKIAKEASYN